MKKISGKQLLVFGALVVGGIYVYDRVHTGRKLF